MIELLTRLDFYASAGRTPWHRASAIAKLLLAAALVGLAVAAPGLRLLLVVHLAAWALALTSGLPLRLVLGAASYPLAFALLFVIGRWDGTLGAPLMIVMRPVTAGLIAVWLAG